MNGILNRGANELSRAEVFRCSILSSTWTLKLKALLELDWVSFFKNLSWIQDKDRTAQAHLMWLVYLVKNELDSHAQLQTFLFCARAWVQIKNFQC